jgi:hypothetical protein
MIIAIMAAVILVFAGALGVLLQRPGTSSPTTEVATPVATPVSASTSISDEGNEPESTRTGMAAIADPSLKGTAGRISIGEEIGLANGWYRGPYEKKMFGVKDSPVLSDVWYKESDGYLLVRFLVTAQNQPWSITSARVEYRGKGLEEPRFRCVVTPGRKIEVTVRTPAPLPPYGVIAPADLLVYLDAIEPA